MITQYAVSPRSSGLILQSRNTRFRVSSSPSSLSQVSVEDATQARSALVSLSDLSIVQTLTGRHSPPTSRSAPAEAAVTPGQNTIIVVLLLRTPRRQVRQPAAVECSRSSRSARDHPLTHCTLSIGAP